MFQPTALPGQDPCTSAARLAQVDEQLARLAAQCRRLGALLELRIVRGRLHEREACRCLSILSQVSTRLASIAAQRAAASGPEELERFFGAVADRVRELGVGGYSYPDRADDYADEAADLIACEAQPPPTAP